MSFTFSGRRALWLVVTAKAVSFFGDQVAAVALLLRLQTEGAGAGAVAALLVADLAPLVLLAGSAGRLADRFGSRVLLGWSGLLQAVLAAGLVATSGTSATLALVAALGAGQAVNGATWQALLASLVPAAELPKAVGLAQAANTVGLIAAPAVAGLLTAWAGARPAIALDAATFLAVTVAGLLAPNRLVAAASGRRRGGLEIVARDPLLRRTVLALAVLILLAAMVNVVDVFLVRDTLGASAAWYGLAGAAYAVGVFAGALLGRRLATAAAQTRAFALAAAVLGAGLAGMGLAPSVAVLTGVSVVTGVANGVLNVATAALIYGRASADERGRVAATVGGATSAAQLLAYVAGGVLASALSPRTIFVLAGVLATLTPLALRGLVARRQRSAAVSVTTHSSRSPAARRGPDGRNEAGQALFSRRSRLGVSRGTSVG